VEASDSVPARSTASIDKGVNAACESVYRHFELVLAIVKAKGLIDAEYLRALITQTKAPIQHPPHAIASLKMCGYLQNAPGWLRLGSWKVISRGRALELLKTYHIDTKPTNFLRIQIHSKMDSKGVFRHLDCDWCLNEWNLDEGSNLEDHFSLREFRAGTGLYIIKCRECGGVGSSQGLHAR
jgi:hypothetical protein